MKKEKVDVETGEVFEDVPRLDEAGHEVLDAKPVEIPAGFKRPETTDEIIRRLVRVQLSEVAGRAGEETFEEANDFDVEDETFEPGTPYEAVFDPILGRDITPAEFERNREAYEQLYRSGVKDISREELRAALVSEHGEAAVTEMEDRIRSSDEQFRRASETPDQGSSEDARSDEV